MVNKLNGWQRLWFVLAVIYVLPVVFITYESIPTQTNINRNYAQETIDIYMTLKHPAIQYESSWKIRDAYKDLSDLELVARIHTKAQEMNLFHSYDFDEADKRYKEKTNGLFKEQVKTVTNGILSWIVPIIAVYAFGWSLGWVYRGFVKKNDGTEHIIKVAEPAPNCSIKNVYKWFKMSYFLTWISLAIVVAIAMIYESDAMILIFGVNYLVWFIVYLVTMGKLAAHMNRSVLKWVGLTMLTKFIGLLVSYFNMKTIAIQEGWE